MNGTTSGAKAGITWSSKEEGGPAKMAPPSLEHPSVIEDARLYPEVRLLSV